MNNVAKKSGSDNYQTPIKALDILLPFIPDSIIKVWEPAAGKFNLVNRLRFHGFVVFSGDIETGQDFFSFSSPVCGKNSSAIITNPPYSIKDKWIKHCFELDIPFALFMPLEALSGVKRVKMWDGKLGLLVPNRRTNFQRTDLKADRPPGTCAWFCYKMKINPGTFAFCDLPLSKEV